MICIIMCLIFASCGQNASDSEYPQISPSETNSINSVNESPEIHETNSPDSTVEPTGEIESSNKDVVLNPDYEFVPTMHIYTIGTDHVICQSDYGLNAGFENKGVNKETSMKGKNFYSMSFAVYTDMDSCEMRITDRKTGKELTTFDDCAVKIFSGRTNYERGAYVENHNGDDWEMRNFKIVIVNSLEKEYTIDQLKIELKGQPTHGPAVDWTEATLVGTADDLPISISEHIKYHFIKIGTEYYYASYPVAFGGGGNADLDYHTSEELTCLSRYYSHSLCETGITSDSVHFYDKETWQPVELPPGLTVIYTEEYDKNILQFRVGVERTDEKLCSREEMEKFFNNSVCAVNINGDDLYITK